MGYSIYIGEGKKVKDEDGEAYRMTVERIESDEAPLFPDDTLTGQSNGRHPSYGAWSEWATIVGLHHFFFDKKEGLMKEHPGWEKLHLRHFWEIRQARKRWEKLHPNAVPGFTEFSAWEENEEYQDEYDPMLARLLWLEFWVCYALKHCKNPVIVNS